MITCELIGRTGNQAFIIAATISAAKINNIPYHIPAHTLNDKEWPPIFGWLENNSFNPNLPIIKVQENRHCFDAIELKEELKETHNFSVQGYRQSWKYMENCREDILKAFGFEHLTNQAECTSIHVRRGDYLLYPKKHPVVTMEYLTKAMRISADEGVTHFALFSDDMPWIREHLNSNKFPDYTFEDYLGNSEIRDMKMMSQCKNNIISNSSFSWWGAWLNQNENKTVITPHEDNWFGIENKHLNVSDLLPEKWIRIKY